MSEEPPFAPEVAAKQPTRARPWLLAALLCAGALIGWLAWPSHEQGISPWDLSLEDGKSRFYATRYVKVQTPPHLSIVDRVAWAWMEFKRRHGKQTPVTYTFSAMPIRPCSIVGLLDQCMEVSGTQYLIAVETVGSVEFGHTNALNGAQFVAAFEHAIESIPVVCYDFAKKRNFQDTLLMIREKPGLVKIVPRSKLGEYQKAGLVNAGAR